ncbi:MAG: hypothetical protein NTW49_02920 [Bacteroidia bacterium]|nr:hypothetical protein [Bacteroidia bacterium]
MEKKKNNVNKIDIMEILRFDNAATSIIKKWFNWSDYDYNFNMFENGSRFLIGYFHKDKKSISEYEKNSMFWLWMEQVTKWVDLIMVNTISFSPTILQEHKISDLIWNYNVRFLMFEVNFEESLNEFQNHLAQNVPLQTRKKTTKEQHEPVIDRSN